MAKNLPENQDPTTGEQKKLTFWNGVSARLYVRKAQYGWGWDWGPVVMTVGPWSECVSASSRANSDPEPSRFLRL